MPRVTFSHTKKLEAEHQASLAKDAAWFRKSGMRACLPSGQHVPESPKEKADLTIRSGRVAKSWRSVESNFFRIVRSFSGVRIPQRIICHVTHFGPEGQYRMPNVVFLRLRNRRDERRAAECIAHELLHLVLYHAMHRKNLTYTRQEGIVDALVLESGLARLFPRYQRQSVGIRVPSFIARTLRRPPA